MQGRKPTSPKVKDLSEGRLTAIDGGKSGAGGGGGGGKSPPPAPPKFLTDALAVALWNDLLPDLIRRKQYLNLFKVELGRYCMAFAEYVIAGRHIDEEGRVVRSPNNYPIQSPWVSIRNRAQDTMQRLAGDLGLNPVAQQRLEGLQLDLFNQPPADGPTGTDGGNSTESRFAQFRGR